MEFGQRGVGGRGLLFKEGTNSKSDRKDNEDFSKTARILQEKFQKIRIHLIINFIS